ncbi:MAG: hypothetical protein JXM68_10805 [Sedimentisphaerales bacterium]|nr:hypothetical protein [Sedimentisphaerales bacterium]
MAATYAPALIKIGDIVEGFMAKYRVPMNDFTNMLLFAFDCLRENMSHTSRLYHHATLTTDANGMVDMPDDMMDFIGIALAGESVLWHFTENSNINADEVSADADVDDGAEAIGYAGRGGINDYYYKLDWNERKIYTDGAEATDIILFYVSTGIRTDEETSVDVTLASVIEAYLYWRLGELNSVAINEIDRRQQNYERAIRLASRYKLPPLRDVWDSILKNTSQGLRR